MVTEQPYPRVTVFVAVTRGTLLHHVGLMSSVSVASVPGAHYELLYPGHSGSYGTPQPRVI